MLFNLTVYVQMTRNNFYNREELTEVKCGQTGTGLLIEHDGHIITENDTVRQIREDIGAKRQFVIPDRFIVSAVFQKYGIKNANGRIYPNALWSRCVPQHHRPALGGAHARR